ncbi:hypothetical protein ACFL5Q_03155 [Planctomycetota bacterium]
MSGRKESEYRLRREREEKLRVLQRIVGLRSEASGLQQRIVALLEDSSEGLRSTFADEVQGTQQWLDQVSVPEAEGMDMDSDRPALDALARQLEQIVQEGREFQGTLTVAFTQKADEMGRQFAGRLADVERLLIKRTALLSLWFGQSQVDESEASLDSARQMLSQERYASLQPALAEFESEVTSKSRFAKEREDKHQKRLYLLKAVRQVCAEMGFKEIDGPNYETEGERGSRIALNVDTVNQGQISFSLALDGISSVSEIGEDRCFDQFGKLSKHLDEEFGIHTKFRVADGEPKPKLIRKGEKDLGDDAARQSEVS